MGRMPVRSAGILLWRRRDGVTEVLLGHMGGPFWTRKDEGAWSIPKGEHDETEEPLLAAMREFSEELGLPVPVRPDQLVRLGDELRLSGGKRLTIYAAEGDLDPAGVVPGMFTMEWPPRSGRTAEFPEIDRAAWWSLEDAERRLVRGQVPFLALLTPLTGDVP
jgi:predicted NUDIX family NTP pyrophosphohydrolase